MFRIFYTGSLFKSNGAAMGRYRISEIKLAVGVRTIMKNLEESWHFRMGISRPGEKP